MPSIRDPLVILRSRLAPFGAEGICWQWTGAVSDRGYGRLSHKGRQWYAHRFAYTVLIGPLNDSMVLDHSCSNHRCCNPEHLEQVTLAENTRRGRRPSTPAPLPLVEQPSLFGRLD